MSQVKQEPDSLQKMIDEHTELRETLSSARVFLENPRPKMGEDGFRRWAGEMTNQLERLREGVGRRLEREEQGRALDKLGRRFPRAWNRVERLKGEHAELLTQMTSLMEDVQLFSEDKAPGDPALRCKLEGVLERIDAHERAETELVQRMYYNDLGGETD